MNPNDVFAPGQKVGYSIPSNPKDWFSYPVTFTSLATAGTPQSTNITIDAGSDFYLTAITYLATSTATAVLTASTRIIPLITLLLTDSGSNRQLMQNAVPLDTIAGNGEWPHRLIMPRLFLRNSNIQIVAANYDTVNTTSVRINFEGFRIYG
jgi:hypothetical protein